MDMRKRCICQAQILDILVSLNTCLSDFRFENRIMQNTIVSFLIAIAALAIMPALLLSIGY